jgi:hypothetical protein
VNFSRTLVRAGAVLASAALLVPAPPSAAATRTTRSDTVVMSVASVSPSTPTPSNVAKPFTVTLTVENKTAESISGVRIIGERGDPIANQAVLDAALADATPPTTPGLPIPSKTPITVDLPAGSKTTVTFATTTSILDDGKGICLCHRAAIYPLFFSAHVTSSAGVDQRLGVAATYMPSFFEKPAADHVSWIWPLLERPHRLAEDTVFTDDLLADSVGPEGRLSRALEVVERAGPTTPLTLLVDPELLDELDVMATEPYTVTTSDGHTIPGTGKAAAVEWLDRFRAVLVADPEVELELTPYADPDVESLTARDMSWTTSMPPAMTTRVTDVLAGRALDSSVAWPARGAISKRTLVALANGGVSTVVLNGSAVTPRPDQGAVPPGLARLEVGHTDIAAALTSATIEKYVNRAITLGGAGAAATLPSIVAELAVRAAQEPDAEHAVTITAPRYVDPDVDAAVQTINDTSRSTFAQPISLRSAVSGSLLPTGRSRPANVPASASVPVTFEAAVHANGAVPVIASLLDQKTDTGAQAFVASLPIAVQRGESAAWRDSEATTDSAYAVLLDNLVDHITAGVHIVNPPSGVYTLASNTSPLPITVDNELDFPVIVRIQVTTVPEGLPGFAPKNIGTQRVDSTQKRTLNVPTTTERLGRIRISAVLLSPNGVPLGNPVSLTVRSTALGVIGIVITVVAGVVLALALLVRFFGLMRKRRAAGAPPTAPEPVDEPEHAS